MLETKRQTHIDAVKAIAILFMVQVHTTAIASPEGVSLSHPLAILSAVIGGMAAPLFVTLSGWGVHSAVRRRLSSPNLVRWLLTRISLLVAMQVVINILLPQRFYWYTPGVLSLLALCTLLAPISVKFLRNHHYLLTFSLLVALSTLLSPDSGSSWSWDQRVLSSGSVEWLSRLLINGTYPLFPWCAFFLAGGALSGIGGSGNLPRSSVVAVALLLVTLGMAMVSETQWALPNGDAVLTFFPANFWFLLTAGAWSHLVWYSAFNLRHKARKLFAIIAPVGKLSLTIYVIHFATLRLLAEWGPKSLTISESFAITVIHSVIWIPLAILHQKRIPNLSLERLLVLISTPEHSKDETPSNEQE
jgi:fucose 4-O-acetylase-like acetyltransferase